MSKSWILVGMMGSGKSAVGRALAERTDREFIDTDYLLSKKVARPIRQFFQIYGEQAFRDLETAILQELEPGNNIISTGGGIVIRDENWQELRRLGTTVYLQAKPETLEGRLNLSRNKRPLLQTEDWEIKLREILTNREELYERADCSVCVDDKEINDVALEIIELLSARAEK